MVRACILFWWVGLLAAGASLARGQEAFPAWSGGVGEGPWETIRVVAHLAPGETLFQASVQDARGGPVFTRTISTVEGRSLLLPLPLVDVGGLPAGQWAIKVSTRSGQGPIQTRHIVLPRRAAGSAAGPRVAMVGSQEIDPAAWTELASRPPELLRISLDELLNDPPLVFASCTSILVDEQAASELTSGRAADLLACGVQLLYRGAASPSGELGAWVWGRSAGGGRFWGLPAGEAGEQGIGPPQVIEPGIAQLGRPALGPGRPLTWVVLAVTPAAMLLVMIVRVFTSQPGWLLGAGGGLLLGLTGGAVYAMSQQVPVMQEELGWTIGQPRGSVAWEERWICRQTLLREHVQVVSRSPAPLLPAVASDRDWWRLRDVMVHLDGFVPGETGGTGEAVSAPTAILDMDVPSRGSVFLHGRWARRGGAPIGTPGWSEPVRLQDGYVTEGSDKRIWSAWAAQQKPNARRALEAWFELRWRVDHTYELRLPAGAGGTLDISDLGASGAEPRP